MELKLNRQHHLQGCTLGELTVVGTQFHCVTLEPGREGKGPIPPGRYLLKWQWSNHFQRQMPYLQNVPNFTGIMIHPGNTAQDTKGCILVGDNPRIRDLENSRDCLTEPIPDKEFASNRGSQGGHPLSDNDLGRVVNSRATFNSLVTLLRQTDEDVVIRVFGLSSYC